MCTTDWCKWVVFGAVGKLQSNYATGFFSVRMMTYTRNQCDRRMVHERIAPQEIRSGPKGPRHRVEHELMLIREEGGVSIY